MLARRQSSPLHGIAECREDVREFHKAFDITSHPYPTIPNEAVRELRIRLLREEVEEFAVAAETCNYIEMVDAIADIIYVAIGASLEMGFDIGPIWQEVHRSNMTKFGGHKDPGGKWIKPDSYSPPDITKKIEEQYALYQDSPAWQSESELP